MINNRNKREGKSLAELSELYLDNREAFEDISEVVKKEKPTFRNLDIKQMNELSKMVSREKYEYYMDNPTVEIEELKRGYVSPQEERRRLAERRKELEMVRKEIELEREELEIEKLRKELGLKFYL